MYVIGTKDGVRSIWRLAVAGAARELREDVRLTTGPGQESSLALTKDGRRLAFTSETAKARIWQFPLDEATLTIREQLGHPLTDGTTKPQNATLSPSGSKIAYVAQQPGEKRFALQVQDIGRQNGAIRLSDHFSRASPIWSPDESLLAYQRSRCLDTNCAAAESQVFVLPATGAEIPVTAPSKWTQEEPGISFLPFDWSPDGKVIAGSSSLGSSKASRFSLALIPMPSQGSVNSAHLLLSDPNYNFWQPHYSPDGRWLAFVAQDANSGSRVAIMPATGGNWSAIGEVGSDKPRWARDGRGLYFLARSSTGINVWKIPFDGKRGIVTGKPVQVTQFDETRRSIQESALYRRVLRRTQHTHASDL